MFDGNRGDYSKIGLIAGSVLAALIAALFIAWGVSKSAEYQRQADNQTREYTAYTDQEIRKACLRLPPVDKQECAAKARHEQRAYQRNEQDLVAQRQSALWAYIMGAAAVIGMGLSVIGVILVWTTFRETRRTAVIAQKNLEVFQQAERGFVRILDMYIIDLPSDPMFKRRYGYMIENFGRSAITVTRTRVWNRADLSWDFDLENTPGYGSVMPVFCKDGEQATVLGNYEMPTDAENNAFFVMVEYNTLGLIGRRTFFAFALNTYPPPGPHIIKIDIIGDRPADT